MLKAWIIQNNSVYNLAVATQGEIVDISCVLLFHFACMLVFHFLYIRLVLTGS